MLPSRLFCVVPQLLLSWLVLAISSVRFRIVSIFHPFQLKFVPEISRGYRLRSEPSSATFAPTLLLLMASDHLALTLHLELVLLDQLAFSTVTPTSNWVVVVFQRSWRMHRDQRLVSF